VGASYARAVFPYDSAPDFANSSKLFTVDKAISVT
jgi:hypothetical protein